MKRTTGSMSLSFPPFTRAVKWLVIANGGIFLLLALLRATGAMPEVDLPLISFRAHGDAANILFGLLPAAITHGAIWQLVTYSFLHAGLFHVLFNMLTLWMF